MMAEVSDNVTLVCMERVKTDELRQRLPELLAGVAENGARFEVVRYKTPMAVLVPIDWFEQAEACLAAREARSCAPGKGMSSDGS